MKRTKLTAIAAALLIAGTSVSCGSKKSSDTSSSEQETTAAVTAEPSEETTAEGTETSSAEVTTAPAETTAPQTTTAAETTAAATESAADAPKAADGYTDSIAIAQDFYKAYLDHDPEKVYSMFDTEEVKGYNALMKDELDGQDPEKVFSKSVIVDAIGQSMDSISEIMAAYSDSPGDTWSVPVTADDIEEPEKESLDEFNGDLKTKYTQAAVINYIFYRNSANEEAFTGNSSAYLMRDGKWYLSFSSLMQSELLNYIDL